MALYKVHATSEHRYFTTIEADSLEEAIDRGQDKAEDHEWDMWTFMAEEVVDVYAEEVTS